MPKRAMKPTALKVLQGNPGKRPLNENEPQPERKIPEKPADMDRVASRTWDELAPKLHALGLLTEIDGLSFRNLCIIRSRLFGIHNKIKGKSGKLVNNDGGVSSYVTMEKQYFQLFRLYAGDFGLSPRGRVGLSVLGEKEGGEFSNLLD